jgi:hypothetical protein
VHKRIISAVKMVESVNVFYMTMEISLKDFILCV